MKKLFLVACLWLIFHAAPASALNFNVTYDASVTNATNAAQIKSAFAAALQTFSDLYTNNFTVKLTVYWGPAGPFTGGIGLGRSQFVLYNTTFTAVTNALRSRRASAADTNSVASLPATDPAPNGVNWLIPLAEAHALGLLLAQTDEDGEVGFATNIDYTFDPNNRSVSGKYDFIGVAQHEVSEVLGRATFDLTTYYIPNDLFRFTASGVRSFDPNATGVYFSADNGVTSLKPFHADPNTGDIQDWASTSVHDAFDASVSSGHVNPLSIADITALDVLGYNGSNTLAPPHIAGTKLANGNFRVSFYNSPGVPFTILATTNLSTAVTNWTSLGTALENPAGQFQYTDTVSPAILRFYTTHSP